MLLQIACTLIKIYSTFTVHFSLNYSFDLLFKLFLHLPLVCNEHILTKCNNVIISHLKDSTKYISILQFWHFQSIGNIFVYIDHFIYFLSAHKHSAAGGFVLFLIYSCTLMTMVSIYILYLCYTALLADPYMANLLTYPAVFLEIRFYGIVTFGQKQEEQEWLLILSIAYPKTESSCLLCCGKVRGEGRQARSKNKLDFLSHSYVTRTPL